LKQWQEENYCGDKSNQNRQRHRRIHLAVRQHRDSAFMVSRIGIRMDQFMKLHRRGEEQQRKKTSEADNAPETPGRRIAKSHYVHRFSHAAR
jgi:hypothetical protein